MDVWLGAANMGFLYAFMALGTYITYRYFNIADITIDGSFTLGAATGAVLIADGWNPFLVLPVSFLAGACAGLVTGFIHTRFRIEALLAGILVMTGLYSVNLHVMGKSNIPLMNHPTFVSVASKINPGINPELFLTIILFLVMLITLIVVAGFLRSDLGLTMLATGNNPVMIAAQGVSTDKMKIIGITLSNGMVGLSGILVAQYQGFADIGMGTGSIIYSLAAVIIGQALFKTRHVILGVLGVICGAVAFRLAVALALRFGVDPNDLKILTSLFVLLTLVVSYSLKKNHTGKLADWIGKRRKLIYALFVVGLISWFFWNYFTKEAVNLNSGKKVKIGIVLANQSDLLVKTRDGFRDEMKRLGYRDGDNVEMHEINAEGDIPSNKTIIDHLISDRVDMIVSISSASTQAAVAKVKDRPVIFATVANPFILGAGTSPINHPSNVTGVYGQAPVEELLKILTGFYPGKIRIGTIYNPGYPNTKVNLGALKKTLESSFPDITLEEMSVSGTSEVMQAAQALASKKISAFYLINDLTVFDALESVIKVADAAKIPVFANDADCLAKGVFLVYGYEYYISGVQAARMADRVIRGESPAGIPYERFAHAMLGVNLDLAAKLGVRVSDSLLKKAEAKVQNGKFTKKEYRLPNNSPGAKVTNIAVFQYASNIILDRAAQGFRDVMIREKYIHKRNLELTFFNAHGEYATAQAVAKDIVSRDFDYIATFSTLSLQTVAGVNTRIPHVFAAVTDPVKAGVAKTLDDHRPNLTGLATPQPVDATIRLMRSLFPRARKIGMVWNTAEINSEICTMMAREASKKYNFQLIEKTVSGTSEVDEAVRALVAAGMEIFFVSGDVTVSQMIPTLALQMRTLKIPFFTNTSDDIKSGTFVSFGSDYYEVGKKSAGILLGLMNGADPVDIPIETYVPKALSINLAIARELKINVADSILRAASVKVDK